MINLSGKDKRSLKLMVAELKQFIIFSITTLFIVLLAISSFLIIKSFVDNVIVLKNYNKISIHVVSFVLVFISVSGLIVFRATTKALLTSKVMSFLIKEAHKAILTSDINEAKNKENEILVKNILKNSDKIANYYIGRTILPFIENVSLLVGLLIASLIVQPIFGLIMLFLLPCFFVACKGIEMVANKMERNYENSYKSSQEKLDYTYEKLKNLKLLNGHKIENNNIEFITNEFIKNSSYKETLNVLPRTVLAILFVGLLLSISLGVGGVLHEIGNMNISSGTFVFYTFAAPVFFILTYRAFHFELNSEETTKSEDEIIKLTLLRTEGKKEPVINLDDIHIVKFKDIQFGSQKEQIISDLTFEVKRGEKLGIYSISKNEKNAVFETFTKLSKQNSGEISINNCDVSKIDVNYLRGIITSLFEDSSLINDTIVNNICYPHDFDEYKYNDALYRSGLKDIILELPNKEETLIDQFDQSKMKYEEFLKRMIFANAFYKDSKIYLLNDVTNDLNPSIESELLNEIFKLKNKIIIMLTDKAYLLNKCDKVLIMLDGKTIEYGKYSELITNKDSHLYKLIRKAPISKVKIS